MRKEISAEEFKGYAGRQLSPSDWITVGQERINQFAACTDDPQFIHVDPERAKRESPFGGTIAHGFLSLSLLSEHGPPDFPIVRDVAFALNYGLDRVRFLTPVPSGSRVRIHTKILSVEEKGPGRLLMKQEKTMEIEGHNKPAYVAEHLGMLVLRDQGE
ncbi:MaoC family dehydratase [Phenylobacterium sp.]|jgi:acyl dehydratase|uniref:MaoC family dehydratase n=1 Tax=Phenylobacterium sp. TaxID=1871053 RepID=UPI002F9210B4